MTPETKKVILGQLGGRRNDTYKELVRVQKDRLARGLSPSEGAAVEALLDEMEAIDAAVAELEAEPAAGAIVTSKTQIREDGSERIVHYLCGDQRATREEALLDLAAWTLKRDRLQRLVDDAGRWSIARERLGAAGFLPGEIYSLDALLRERRALWEALNGSIGAVEIEGWDVTKERAVLNSSWLADPANREGGAG